MSFMPDGYEPPTSQGNNYMKFEQGDNKFRILSDKLTYGYEYWTNENKPVRLREKPKTQPTDMRVKDGYHWDSEIKHFWAMAVWNYKQKRVQVLEITQASIQNALTGYFKNEDWGHPKGYDITVKRAGEGLETRYAVLTTPPKAITAEIQEAWIGAPVNVEALFDSGDPFSPKDTVASAPAETAPMPEPPQPYESF